MTAAFEVVSERQTRFGRLCVVALPGTRDPVPDAVLARLHPEEAEVARSLHGFRQAEWAGGRLAARAACHGAALPVGPVLKGELGGPVAAAGVQVSFSHKRTLAAALVAPDDGARVGLDVELVERERGGVAERILRPEELRAVGALEEHERWAAVVGRFAVKEAVYKALHPFVRRYVGFHEASVALAPAVRVALHLAHADGAFEVEAELEEEDELRIALVRIRRR